MTAATLAPRAERQAGTRAVRTVHVISGLQTGGAETMLYKLLAAIPRERQHADVVSLLTTGTVGPRLSAIGVSVRALGLTSPLRLPGAALALRSAARTAPADVVIGWMYHGNLAATLAARLAMRGRVIWNVRHSVYSLADEKPGTARIIRLGARLSRGPAAIVYNSETSRRQHEALGYAGERSVVIPNGFDAERFAPDRSARASVRSELGLDPDAPLIGLVARLHPMKDHEGLLRACARLRERHPQVHVLLAGRDVTADNTSLAALVTALSLHGHVHFLGERADVPRLTAALDVAMSSSWSEAFPNAVGEAMSCGVPCVVTDVGDSAALVDDTGRVVRPRDPDALAAACGDVLSLAPERRAALGLQARARIVERYAIGAIAERFQRLCETVAAGLPLTTLGA